MKIFFIRHGETIGDVENRFGGTYDDHLSERGVDQATELAATLKDKGIQIVFSSSLIRAQETAKVLAVAAEVEVKVNPDLRERNQYSFLSGVEKEEAKQKYPNEVELLKDRLNTIEGAESYEDFSNRISGALQSLIVNSQYETIAVVSHGGGFRVLFRDILKWGELKEIGDCACVELQKDGDAFKWISAERLVPDFQTS